MPRIAVEDLNFYYQQTGEGPDVVLIHGATGNMAIWPLIDLIDNLAADFRVTYYDLRGHGYSDTPPTGYTSADMAGDLYKLQQTLGLEPSYLVGHSFGAVIAMHAAVLHPEMVKGVVVSDPFFPALHEMEADITDWVGWESYREQAARHGLEVSPDDWFDVDHVLQQAATLTPERRKMFVDELGEPALERLVRLAATTCGKDTGRVAGLSQEKILSVTQPVLGLFGENSPFLATCHYLEDHLPDCKTAFVPDAEHLAHKENPEQFVALVQKHLRQMAGMTDGWTTAGAETAGGNS